MLTIRDDFFPSFDIVREWADNALYDEYRSPVDGVIYPGINADIPDWIRAHTQAELQAITGSPREIKHIFTRLSLEGNKAPHQAHTDSTMGGYSLMVYLNRPQDCRGGTSIVRHRETGMYSNPKDAIEEYVWKRDTNRPQAWEIIDICWMEPNRACIFPAELMHRAEPVGGFGKDAKHGRLVLTAFFT
jgi:hypothetical protein